MKIRLLYFAAIKEKTGINQEDMILPESGTVRQLLERFRDQYPETTAILQVSRVAVNQDFVDFDHQLQEDDEVAFIPPVAGGENITSSTPVWIQEDTLELTPILKAITAPHLGAQVIMLGTVRDHNQGEAVTQLKYEAYIPMVEKVLAAILNDTKTEFPDVQLAVSHRVADLKIGDRAVIVGAGAPHRDEAFKACRAVIESLKQQAPIWKYETRVDGQTWIGLGP